MQLMSLQLKNFKGVRSLQINTLGHNVSVYGDNGTGKTTIFDAFTWLLFDKDSTNRKDFEIKTLDADGQALHGLEHEVEGVLKVHGKQITLRKVYAEKWTKKRGSATAEFTGHSTDYYIDDVPVKKNEYMDRVDRILQEDIFKLLTSPAYFNDHLKWQDRRKILLEVCGDVTDAEVITHNSKLDKLPAVLGDRNIEDHRKVIASKRAEINKELDKIPVRIDEAQRSTLTLPDEGERFFDTNIRELRDLINSKEAEAFRLRTGGQITVKENRLREIEGELLEIKNRAQSETLESVVAKQQTTSALKSQCGDLERKISDISWTVDRNSQRIGEYQAEASRLRQQWHEVDGEVFENHHDTNCPACGQALPEDQVRATHEKALALFNKSKSIRLEQISEKGKSHIAEADRLKGENEELSKQIEMLKQQQAAKESELRKAESELNQLQAGMTDIESDPQYISKKQEAAVIQQEILQIRNSIQESISKVQAEIADLKMSLEALEQEKAKFAQVKVIEKRIQDLKEQERELAAEYERLEQELYLTEEFIRTKVKLLEEKINSKFKFARFKLFEQQVNGGLSEVCETTFGGVPYSSGLNNAARINVGLDIINTLSEHYGFTAPIFIDNAEAVTRFIGTTGQQIRLAVSEMDKQLRVETESQNIREAI